MMTSETLSSKFTSVYSVELLITFELTIKDRYLNNRKQKKTLYL